MTNLAIKSVKKLNEKQIYMDYFKWILKFNIIYKKNNIELSKIFKNIYFFLIKTLKIFIFLSCSVQVKFKNKFYKIRNLFLKIRKVIYLKCIKLNLRYFNHILCKKLGLKILILSFFLKKL